MNKFLENTIKNDKIIEKYQKMELAEDVNFINTSKITLYKGVQSVIDVKESTTQTEGKYFL